MALMISSLKRSMRGTLERRPGIAHSHADAPFGALAENSVLDGRQTPDNFHLSRGALRVTLYSYMSIVASGIRAGWVIESLK